jgi:hypothetical protein
MERSGMGLEPLNVVRLSWEFLMPHGFDMYRVFISGPGDLERDRQTCLEAISEVNETKAMPLKMLLVSVGLTSDDQIVGYRSAVAENVRQSTYFIQLFEDDWGPKNLFRKTFYLAVECRNDSAMPMRELIVCLKAAPRETDPEILAFRKELEDLADVRIFHYTDLAGLKEQLLEVCGGWVGAGAAAE